MARALRGYVKAGVIGAAVGMAFFTAVTQVGPRLARGMMRH